MAQKRGLYNETAEDDEENLVTNEAPAFDTADDFKPNDDLFFDLKAKVIEARDHYTPWWNEARQMYDFYAGRQWSEDDRQVLEAQLRPVITFNRIAPVVDSLIGLELNDRKQVKYYPRTQGDVAINELYTNAAMYVRDETNADDEESDAFMDLAVCGMGWTDTHLVNDRSENGALDISVDRVDPLEMSADPNSKKRNLADARYLVRARELPLTEAEQMFPGFEPAELNAAWAAEHNNQELVDSPVKYLFSDQNSVTGDRNKKRVTIVEIQWWEKRRFYEVFDPSTNETVHMDEAKYQLLKKRYPAVQKQYFQISGQVLPELKVAQYKRRVYRRAFLGNVILKLAPLPYQYGFSYNCMTGKRDRNKRQWFGLIRAMKDPQEWANKWLSQMLHIINSNAKGGLMAPKSAFDDWRFVEQNYGRPDAIMWTKDANSLNAIKQRDATSFPAGLYQLMEFAISSIRDANGFNLELLGLADRNQPSSLEYQRRQSGMTVLAQFFSSLRHYRKAQGKGMLYMIQKWLGDGRLIRITTDDGNREQYVPLIVNADQATLQYDVAVDEIAASPNQKEQVWSMLVQAMPFLQSMNIPGSAWADIIKYSPLPDSLATKISAALQVPPDEAQQAFAAKMQQLTMALADANVKATNADAAKNMADVQYKAAQSQKSIADANNTALETQVQSAELVAAQSAQRAQQITETVRALAANSNPATQSPFAGQMAQPI